MTMQALEMEEAESFLETETDFEYGNGGSLPVSPSKTNKPPKSGGSIWRNILIAVAMGGVLFIIHNVTAKVEEAESGLTSFAPPAAVTETAPLTPIKVPATPASTPASATGAEAFSTGGTTPAAVVEEEVVDDKPFSYSKLSAIVPDPFHVPLDTDETATKKLAAEWGKWHFWDGDEETRPSGDYCGQYKNRDIPGDEFPDDAWQNDAVFVNHIINDAEQLVSRAMEAIFVEYGHGKPLKAQELAARQKMFRMEKIDLAKDGPPAQFTKRGDKGNGGWTTNRSFDGLIRRLLHAIMTNDTFTVVMGGHSAAAGHGNHFHQSYMMQFHKIMAPIFARLGVKLVTKNMAQGGLGTVHNALGMGSLYGDEIDLLLWDSGMTEPSVAHQDLFLRQGLLGGKRVPVVWGGNFNILRDLHELADVDVGQFGAGTDAVIPVESEEQALKVPYASRYMKCDKEQQDLCNKESRYCTKCWIPRDDIDPEKVGFRISSKFGGQVKWHPGWRSHQLVGRTIAFSVLQALQEAIQIFSDGTMGGPPLDEDYWHMTAYYDNIRSKMKALNDTVGSCYSVGDKLPPRVCNTAMKASSLHTPRANPSETSITKLLKPTPDGYVPRNTQMMVYEGPDVHNTCYDVHDGETDVLAVISGRRRLDDALTTPTEPFSKWDEWSEPEATMLDEQKETNTTPSLIPTWLDISSRQLDETIVPGKGWQVVDEPPGKCDGEYDSICDRKVGSDCPLRGHHDARGMVAGTDYSGWLVMEIPDVTEGIIMLKFFTWIKSSQVTRTMGWKSVNNEGRKLRSAALNNQNFSTDVFNDEYEYLDSESPSNQTRRLELPDTFMFDYAINGKVSTMTRDQFKERLPSVQRVVDIFTLLDDPNFVTKPTNVEVAFRMRGCDGECAFGLTHVYWA